jgi:hypothetical protein
MKISLIISLLISPISIFCQQDLTPLQIVEDYFSPNGFTNKSTYFCCELERENKTDTTWGQRLPIYVHRKCALIEQNDSTAIVSIELKDTTSGIDYYMYLEKKAHWQVKSMRCLAMTNWAYTLLNDLQNMPKDSIEQFNKENLSGYAYEIGKTKLWISLDSEIIAHFNNNKNLFEEFIYIIQNKGYLKATDYTNSGENIDKDAQIRQILNKIFINRVLLLGEEDPCQTCLQFNIAGMVDNSVGFFYQPDITKIPKISDNEYIIIKAIGNGWYLYKTT